MLRRDASCRKPRSVMPRANGDLDRDRRGVMLSARGPRHAVPMEGIRMDVAFLTIAELNRLYDKRELSPVEVTTALINRIAAHDARLHSFLLVTEEVALEQARTAERELMAGARRGPLHGIPYALKDPTR
jgi:hypothetical protein